MVHILLLTAFFSCWISPNTSVICRRITRTAMIRIIWPSQSSSEHHMKLLFHDSTVFKPIPTPTEQYSLLSSFEFFLLMPFLRRFLSRNSSKLVLLVISFRFTFAIFPPIPPLFVQYIKLI